MEHLLETMSSHELSEWYAFMKWEDQQVSREISKMNEERDRG